MFTHTRVCATLGHPRTTEIRDDPEQERNTSALVLVMDATTERCTFKLEKAENKPELPRSVFLIFRPDVRFCSADHSVARRF